LSQTYIAILVNILVQFLPKLGLSVGSEELTVTVQTLVLIGSSAWVLIRRYNAGGVTLGGFRK